MKATAEIIKKYEGMIHFMLRKKQFHLLKYEDYEDLVQQGRLLIIEGLRDKYQEDRASISTFLYMFLDSRLSSWNKKRSDAYYAYNKPKHVNLGFKVCNKTKSALLEEDSDVLDNFLFHAGRLTNSIENKIDLKNIFRSLTPNKQIIFEEYYIHEKPIKWIAKRLGSQWTINRVKKEIQNIYNYVQNRLLERRQ